MTYKINKIMQAKTYQIILKQITQAIQHLHDKNIIHRDIKPANIVLHRLNNSSPCSNLTGPTQKEIQNKSVILKIADFGHARVAHFSKDREYLTMTACGSPKYIAPEIIKYETSRYNDKVDLWSVGVLRTGLLLFY